MKTSKRLRHAFLMMLIAIPVFGDEPQEESLSADGPFVKPGFTYTRRCLLPSHGSLRNDPVAEWAFSTAIFRSIVLPVEKDYTYEEGGWIYQCRRKAADGKFEYYIDALLVDTMSSKPNSQDKVEHSRTFIQLDDGSFYAHAPGNSECRTVGNFHTHPSYAVPDKLLSDADLAGADRRGIPAFMIKNESDPDELDGNFPHYTAHEYGPWAGGWNKAGKDNLSWRCEEPTASATIIIDSPDLGRITLAIRAKKRGGKEGSRFELYEWLGRPVLFFQIFDKQGGGVMDIFAPARIGSWSQTKTHGEARVSVHPNEGMLSNMGQVFPYELEITEYEPGTRIAGSFRGVMRSHSKDMGNSGVSGTFFVGPPDEHPPGIDFPDVNSDTPIG